LGHALEARGRIPYGNTGNCASRTLNTNFCSGGVYITLNHLYAPPPSAGGEFDLALRRVLRQTAITPPQFDENSSFEEIVTQLYDLHVGTVTKFP